MKYKIGDKIILKKSNNSLSCWEGHALEVVQVYGEHLSCKNLNIGGGTANVYYGDGGRIDEFVMADRKNQILSLEENLIELRERCLSIERELKDLKKFPTEEDAVAHKINEIIKSKGNTAGIAAILKELKTSNYL